MSPGASGWGGADLPALKHRGFCTQPCQARLRVVWRYLPCVASLIIGFCIVSPALFLLPGVATQTRCSDGNERHLQQGLTVTRPAESCRMFIIAHERVVHRAVSIPLVNARFTLIVFNVTTVPHPSAHKAPCPPPQVGSLALWAAANLPAFRLAQSPRAGPFHRARLLESLRR